MYNAIYIANQRDSNSMEPQQVVQNIEHRPDS